MVINLIVSCILVIGYYIKVELFFYIGIAVIALISVFLAYKSMRDFQEVPANSAQQYSLFLVRNTHSLTPGLLNSLHKLFSDVKMLFSFEKILKGKEQALVLYAPVMIAQHLKELELLEIEDYFKEKDETNGHPQKLKINIDTATTWVIKPKSDIKIPETLFSHMELEENQSFFFQIVGVPASKTGEFQVTLRCMAVDPVPAKKIELAKKMEHHLKEHTGLEKIESDKTMLENFESFRKRALVPKEVSKFELAGDQIAKLLR